MRTLQKTLLAEQTVEQLKEIPEVQSLKDIVENNKYHINQTVLDHTEQVYDNILKIMSELAKQDNSYEEYLSEDIGMFNRIGLLMIATYLHDIAKPETFGVKEDGKTNCIGHAKQGSEKAYKIIRNYGLNGNESDHVEDLVAKHMDILNLYNGLANAKNSEKIFEKARKKLGDKYIEVLIHSKADLLGCNGQLEGDTVKLYGQEFNNPIAMVDYLLDNAFKVKQVKGTVQELEQYVKQGTVYIDEDLKQGVEQGLEFLYKQDMQKKVDKGKINPEKVDIKKVVDKRVQGMMKQLKFGQAPTDYKAILEQKPIEYNLN